MKKVLVCISIVALVVIVFFVFSSSDGNRAVDIVKNGNLDGYPGKTLGQALESFMSNVKWEPIKADNSEIYVNIRGGLTYNGAPVNGLVQYHVDLNTRRFTFQAFEINGQPMNLATYLELIEKAFE